MQKVTAVFQKAKKKLCVEIMADLGIFGGIWRFFFLVVFLTPNIFGVHGCYLMIVVYNQAKIFGALVSCQTPHHSFKVMNQ